MKKIEELILGKKVIHSDWGEGIIKSVDNKYFDIEFQKGEPKRFKVPDSIEFFNASDAESFYMLNLYYVLKSYNNCIGMFELPDNISLRAKREKTIVDQIVLQRMSAIEPKIVEYSKFGRYSLDEISSELRVIGNEICKKIINSYKSENYKIVKKAFYTDSKYEIDRSFNDEKVKKIKIEAFLDWETNYYPELIFRKEFDDTLLLCLNRAIKNAESQRILTEANDINVTYSKLMVKLAFYGFEGPVHITELDNFIGMMKSGIHKSRGQMIREGIHFDDKALPGAINRTDADAKENARFYYRFNTPSHVTANYENPVGIVISPETFKLEKAIFYNISAVHAYRGYGIREALSFNWDSIFSNGYIGMDKALKNARNAEFGIRNGVSTEYIVKLYFPNTRIMENAKAELGSLLDGIEMVVDSNKFLHYNRGERRLINIFEEEEG